MESFVQRGDRLEFGGIRIINPDKTAIVFFNGEGRRNREAVVFRCDRDNISSVFTQSLDPDETVNTLNFNPSKPGVVQQGKLAPGGESLIIERKMKNRNRPGETILYSFKCTST